jgi:hypothetical protein
MIAELIRVFNPPVREVEKDPLLTKVKRLNLIGTPIVVPAIAMIWVVLQWGGSTYF